MNGHSTARRQFLEDYRVIRHAEGRGSDTSSYYRALPFCQATDPNAAMWKMRSRTYRYFEKNILRLIEMRAGGPLDVLDLGAGNCWLSHRLSLRQHRPIALDIFSDKRDGLQAASHYPKLFPVIEADFDQIPLPSATFDLAVFNASLHYSVDYIQTLSEVRRCLRPSGSFVILDTPIYRLREHGVRMVAEKHAQFQRKYGFRSDALRSQEFLDLAMLQVLSQTLGIEWQTYKPWYGVRWHLRPLNAFLRRRRPPSRFWILVGKFRST